MKALLFLFLFCARISLAQVAYVDKNQAPDFKFARNTYVVLASERPKTLEKLAPDPVLTEAYRKAVADYNATLKEVFAEKWTLNKVQFKTWQEIESLREGSEYATTFIIATSDSDDMLSDAAKQALKKKATTIDLDKFLSTRDEQGSIDIFNLSQWKEYWITRNDWALKQSEKMKLDKKLGKKVEPGNYLKRRVLSLTGFYLSQHALLTRSDLLFGLHYLQADLTAASVNTRKVQVNQPVMVKGFNPAGRTLLIGRDLVTFPNGKSALDDKKIASLYAHPFRIVSQSEIEEAIKQKQADVAVIIPATRWSATGYPELQVFYVVDPADGRTVLSYADTGSGSNAMTANAFERSAELKAKHLQEIKTNGEK